MPALRAAHPAINPGYHLDKRHWNTVTLDGSLPESMVRDLVEDSYDLVVMGLPKAARERLRPRRPIGESLSPPHDHRARHRRHRRPRPRRRA